MPPINKEEREAKENAVKKWAEKCPDVRYIRDCVVGYGGNYFDLSAANLDGFGIISCTSPFKISREDVFPYKEEKVSMEIPNADEIRKERNLANEERYAHWKLEIIATIEKLKEPSLKEVSAPSHHAFKLRDEHFDRMVKELEVKGFVTKAGTNGLVISL